MEFLLCILLFLLSRNDPGIETRHGSQLRKIAYECVLQLAYGRWKMACISLDERFENNLLASDQPNHEYHNFRTSTTISLQFQSFPSMSN
jgi:hypothetical protein